MVRLCDYPGILNSTFLFFVVNNGVITMLRNQNGGSIHYTYILYCYKINKNKNITYNNILEFKFNYSISKVRCSEKMRLLFVIMFNNIYIILCYIIRTTN